MNQMTQKKICSFLMKEFEQESTETVFWTLNRLVPSKVHYMEKNPGMFSSKIFISF